MGTFRCERCRGETIDGLIFGKQGTGHAAAAMSRTVAYSNGGQPHQDRCDTQRTRAQSVQLLLICGGDVASAS